ncbi:FGGY carbohydrate kinase domain-containing protein [Frankliniella occidentalis]|uniref:FGGY carbohydrate kinase domain-containing protein n=1 Tax=Frankliniella occidentalis TaxID=133901 RepID=A0A6J1SUA1_FRAOC|nr:FGGY carbohydrate kinase domain-containing protein [Frankliniella occidentalis]
MANKDVFVIGVDVGTGSARAALVSASSGHVRRVAVRETKTWTPRPEYFQQSTENIWGAVCAAVKEVAQDVPGENIRGIGFDATCSLAVLDQNHLPVTVSPFGESDQNVILWMDHRSNSEAAFINSLKPKVLKYVGGTISPEMQTPKLLWLKKNIPQSWKSAYHFMDLPDFLTWKATGSHSRSLCSLVCKWTYIASEKNKEGWDENYFKSIGLEDLLENNSAKIGNEVLDPGTPVGKGLSDDAAAQLGLKPGIKVATSIIDAHAGGVGLMGCNAEKISTDFTSRLALISGTSTCHMVLSNNIHFVDGLWGPYWSAMVPNLWLTEGGQTCTGHLVDHIINTHPATSLVKSKLGANEHIQHYLNGVLEELAKQKNLSNTSFLTKHLHMWPDFHGNRSPLADPTLLGMVSGITLAKDEESLAILYLTTIQALAYGTKHIINALVEGGITNIQSVLLCGGLSRNPLFVQVHADVLGLPVLCAREPESVLLGSAVLAAYSAGIYSSVGEAMIAMGGFADVVTPNEKVVDSRYHDKKFEVFMKMVKDQKEYRDIMEL